MRTSKQMIFIVVRFYLKRENTRFQQILKVKVVGLNGTILFRLYYNLCYCFSNRVSGICLRRTSKGASCRRWRRRRRRPPPATAPRAASASRRTSPPRPRRKRRALAAAPASPTGSTSWPSSAAGTPPASGAASARCPSTPNNDVTLATAIFSAKTIISGNYFYCLFILKLEPGYWLPVTG